MLRAIGNVDVVAVGVGTMLCAPKAMHQHLCLEARLEMSELLASTSVMAM